MNLIRALFAGVAGGAAMTAAGALFRLVGLAPMNLERIWGSNFTGASGPGTWLLGLAIHLAVAGGVGLLYAAVMLTLRHPGWRAGLGLSFLHFAIAGLFLTVVVDVNSAVASGRVGDPGGFGSAMGFGGFFFLLWVHMAYGATMGFAYAPPREPVPPPGSDELEAYEHEVEARR